MERKFSKAWVTLLIIVLMLLCSCSRYGNTIETSIPPETGSTLTSLSTNTQTIDNIAPVNIDKSVVQVWIGENLEATGVAVGDGNQVLTAINYEVSYPESVNVITSNGDNFSAVIQALDPRTGATLLDVAGMQLPPAKQSEATLPMQEQTKFAAWYGQTYTKGGPGKPELEKTGVTITTDADGIKLHISFSSTFPGAEMNNPPSIRQGAVITDEKGAVLGLAGVDYMSLFPHPHLFPFVPPGFTISSALELLSPDFVGKPYANGPLMIVITAGEATAMHLAYFANYNDVTMVMQKTLKRLGMPLKLEELPENIRDVTSSTKDGNSVTVVYARHIELSTPDGTIHIQAKWVSIQWNRSGGKPNALFYGSGRLELEGGFQMPDDLSVMLAVIDPLSYHHP